MTNRATAQARLKILHQLDQENRSKKRSQIRPSEQTLSKTIGFNKYHQGSKMILNLEFVFILS